MSEYQFYEFLAVDRPLDARQLGEVRSLSTRADITATSFVNVYHWGNFRGNPRAMMERYYDAHLYLTNWGTREVMLRLPASLLDPGSVDAYCLTDSSTAWTNSGNIIIAIIRDGDGDGDFDEDGYGLLGSIVSVRAELAAGDLRPLYLAWLHSVAAGELDDDEIEPPVPANLATLSAGQRSLVDFIRLDQDLLDTAAAGSRRRDPATPTKTQLAAWVRALPAVEKDALIVALMRGDEPHLGSQLLRRYHGGPELDTTTTGGRRTVGQLLVAAQKRREHRARLAAAERERQRAKQERNAAAARQRRLDALASEGDRAWQRVVALVDARKAKEYDAAVSLLSELRDLSDRAGNREAFTAKLRQLTQRYTNRPALLERLTRAGLTAL